MKQDRIDVVIARAFDIGRDDGIDMTAGWLRRLWEGQAGDQPEPDLSGEWADSPTPANVLVRALAFVGINEIRRWDDDELTWIQDEVCEAYDAGFRHGRDWLMGSETWSSVVAAR